MKSRSIARWVVPIVLTACGSQPAIVHQIRKEQLVTAIRQRLLESVEAEKSAVLATTDHESREWVLEAQSAAAEIDRLRAELRPLILTDGHRDELEKLEAFDATWADFEDVDTRLFALAIANTNVKAARLAEEEGAAALDRFLDALTTMQEGTSDPDVIRQLASASVAAVRAQSLLLVHIPTAGDAAMTRLEQRIRELNETVDGALAGARGWAHVSPDQLETAARAWSDYRRMAVEVLRLSRENTNVISFDVSIHEKRHATKDCLAALSALLAAIEAGPHATR